MIPATKTADCTTHASHTKSTAVIGEAHSHCTGSRCYNTGNMLLVFKAATPFEGLAMILTV